MLRDSLRPFSIGRPSHWDNRSVKRLNPCHAIIRLNTTPKAWQSDDFQKRKQVITGPLAVELGAMQILAF